MRTIKGQYELKYYVIYELPTTKQVEVQGSSRENCHETFMWTFGYWPEHPTSVRVIQEGPLSE